MKTAKTLLLSGIPDYQVRIEKALIATLLAEFQKANKAASLDTTLIPEWQLAKEWMSFLLLQITNYRDKLAHLAGQFELLANRCTGTTLTDKRVRGRMALTEKERHESLLTFSREMGASLYELFMDRRALSLYLDFDAMSDRYQANRSRRERDICFCLRRIGALGALALAGQRDQTAALWQELDLEAKLRTYWNYKGNPTLRKEAYAAFTDCYRALPETLHDEVSDSMIRHIYQVAQESGEQVWYHIEAIRLLVDISPPAFEKVMRRWFLDPEGDSSIFIRARIVRTWGRALARHLEDYPQYAELAEIIFADPSPFVRQAFAEVLPQASPPFAEKWLGRLLSEDDSYQVRAEALLALPICGYVLGPEPVMHLWVRAFQPDCEPFLLRTALKTASDLVDLWREDVPFCQAMANHVSRLQEWQVPLSIRREAACIYEQIWLLMDPEASAYHEELEALLKELPPGKRIALPKQYKTADRHKLGRVLSVLAQKDFGLDLEPHFLGEQLRRGPVFGFRWWRCWHELKNPSPAKRQGVSHVVGRISRGRLRAPSAILAELSEAKVPGEPVFLSEEGGWRPYLPLLEDVLSSLDFNVTAKPIRFYSSEGVTVLQPPPSFLKRMTAFLRISLRYKELVNLRNWTKQSSHKPDAYLSVLQELGFTVQLESTSKQRALDPTVARFFPMMLPLPLLDAWHRMKEFVFSIYGNSIHELIVFLGAGTTFFLTRLAVANTLIRRARRRVPLVVGGWGTRGKSGTERLKAALFAALGYSVFSKTTGCEAMFVSCEPFGRLDELPLFRPYDKATIWEQGNVIRMADGLGCEVFLWECMGLNPEFVHILQRQWMRDDIGTITNTFPDHEDIQGPAGYNIPIVMTEFIPRNAQLLVTEESMYPILEHACKGLGTSIKGFGWLEAGLITKDVLDRFPYEEHPYNIALVVGLASELGVDRDFALKEMADRVVPDLGVLKTFPAAAIETRSFIFSSGQSANERLGCMTNWTRLGFDSQDPDVEPGVFISTVVNNRADRISRSQMFADIMVRDLSIDKHFLIGSNLDGMMRYLEDAWSAYAGSFGIFIDNTPPQERLAMLAQHLRIATSENRVQGRLRVMLNALLGEAHPQLECILEHWNQPDTLAKALADEQGLNEKLLASLLAFHLEYHQQYSTYCEIRAEITDFNGDKKAMEDKLLEQARQWFFAKIFVVEDYHASGESIIHTIIQNTPPGFVNRNMGMQNIKGTGLDFAYRFLAWDRCFELCAMLASENEDTFAKGLDEMMSFRDYGVMSVEHARQAIEATKGCDLAQSPRCQAQLAVIESRYKETIAALASSGSKSEVKSSWLMKAVAVLEALLDSGDAVRRRKKASKIYHQMVHKRISRSRAQSELALLNKRQKGGWLWKQLQGYFNRYR